MTTKPKANTETGILLVNVDNAEDMSDATKDMSPAELAEFLAAVEEGMADIRAGRTISAEKVRAWIESLGSDHELPIPECDE